MSTLKVINGISKPKFDYFDAYSRMYSKAIKELVDFYRSKDEISTEILKKVVFSGVKMMNLYDVKMMSKTEESFLAQLEIFNFIKLSITQLTPSEVEKLFPITKEYDGERFESKDYFFTKKFNLEIGEHNTIGENLDEFLWNYQNWDVTHFAINELCILSDIRRLQGHKGLMDEFLEEQGVPTYTMAEDHQGKNILINNQTGEETIVKKKRPRYLKPL
ncbi:hypothetical protein [Cytobacillus horneckiae]|uniref:Uncharacterized protein n=1 Tax=Cytobacillus horneckiae TaxID=549687 RepID=A0A2N0ZB73_9BACI|nr:hypothetical protein [Cytobacillus horneckiae]MEC1155510.1 hypothetical protein [Cytobacillus horneckiae]MED2936829.1 hypothetical protein [Cytobacillus horneckiae]PKG26750.1 hypothetical protein CWS20_22485 [Cytobacillus horneckiae]